MSYKKYDWCDILESMYSHSVRITPSEMHLIKSNKLKMTAHNIKVLGGLAIVFIIGGLQALKGLNLADSITTLLPVLVALEHILNGNTSS